MEALIAYAPLVNTVATAVIALLFLNQSKRQAKMADTVEVLEKNTNSIKDALVASTHDAALAAGKVAGRLEVQAEVAQEAKGALAASQRSRDSNGTPPAPVIVENPGAIPVTVKK